MFFIHQRLDYFFHSKSQMWQTKNLQKILGMKWDTFFFRYKPKENIIFHISIKFRFLKFLQKITELCCEKKTLILFFFILNLRKSVSFFCRIFTFVSSTSFPPQKMCNFWQPKYDIWAWTALMLRKQTTVFCNLIVTFIYIKFTEDI